MRPSTFRAHGHNFPRLTSLSNPRYELRCTPSNPATLNKCGFFRVSFAVVWAKSCPVCGCSRQQRGGERGSGTVTGLSPTPSPPRQPLVSTGTCSTAKAAHSAPRTQTLRLAGLSERFTASISMAALSHVAFDKGAA